VGLIDRKTKMGKQTDNCHGLPPSVVKVRPPALFILTYTGRMRNALAIPHGTSHVAYD